MENYQTFATIDEITQCVKKVEFYAVFLNLWVLLYQIDRQLNSVFIYLHSNKRISL